jgi:hypothetical protein
LRVPCVSSGDEIAGIPTFQVRLVDASVHTWTLDSIDEADRARDRRDIAAAVAVAHRVMTYDHLRSAADPMLWVADAAAWDVTHDRRRDAVEVIDVP